MEDVLTRSLREKSGSDSYNRYEYQVCWVMHHMLNKYKNNEKFIVFCEFHDDMAETSNDENPNCMEFFQVKTKKKGKFTLSELFWKPKRKAHSFMGYVFYNFTHFNNSCNKCHFIGNREFDEEVMVWQAIIRDGKSLKAAEPVLYEKIKNMLKKEFIGSPNPLPVNFDFLFDYFIQNTYITTSDLPLDKHDTFLKGEFFEAFKFETLQLGNAHLIFDTILNEVRKKTKLSIDTPISFNELKHKKGISSDIFNKIESLNENTAGKIYGEFEKQLKDYGYHLPQINVFKNKLKDHHAKLIDLNNVYYQNLVANYKRECFKELEENFENLDDKNVIKRIAKKVVERNYKRDSEMFLDKITLEVIFYECILSE